jgi:hypothetical protein
MAARKCMIDLQEKRVSEVSGTKLFICSSCFFLFTSMAQDYIYELQPPTGLLFIPQVIYQYEAAAE